MAFPKNAQKKIAELQATIESLRSAPMNDQGEVATLERPEYDLVMGFKAVREGPFHGLWQLYRIVDGKPQQVGGATSKLLVINMARNEIVRTIV